MTIPNFITVARLLCVPAFVYAMLLGNLDLAFALFLAAGISDGIDGFIARHFDQRSELGAYLDPIADKLLLVSVFVMLGYLGELPLWLVVMVVSRDLLIMAAVVVSSLLHKPVAMRPILVSKANTAFQIALALLVLAELAFSAEIGDLRFILLCAVAVLTVLSAAAYLMDWLRHMSGSFDAE
ncbi:CDP-alcohol phosphatidyltransferase family protein [Pararhizobium haloflavum]|uniref:CDP-alcohol phosphatidyltransferase family protein n=1 Tax=Pararhizobium haloflavum TaxID=2037914 RepID=UPI000C19C666|nr:CDP-alcohol phosphatidyltransferase family protein [Pararhizobium haloflavum]